LKRKIIHAEIELTEEWDTWRFKSSSYKSIWN